MIYDPDYANDVAAIRSKQKGAELETLYKVVTDICTKIGLPMNTVDERLSDIDDCILKFFETLQKDVQDEYDKLCIYKEELLNKIQKMTSDLYLPAYIPEDNITLLQHCKRLKTEFNKLNVVREKRMVRLRELRERQTQLCIVLGIRTPAQIKMQTDIPTDDELTQFATVIHDLEKEEKRRKEKFKLLKDMIFSIANLLEMNRPTEFDQPDYSETNLQKMSELHSKLERDHAKNRQKYAKLREQLISLYDRLDIFGPEREQFLATHSECKNSLMVEMEMKIHEYEELKKQNIGKFITKIKCELEVEYERCYLTQEQQDQFFAIDGEATEELLKLCENELERLKNYFEDNRDILERFQKWRLMWKELIDLEIKASDPNRFNNRGGQLLAEERKRKALQRNLPKIEKELIDLNNKYASTNGSKFKVFGTNLDEFIAGCWDELNQAKEEEKRERQRAKMTPSKKNTTINRMAAVRGTPLKRTATGIMSSRLAGAVSMSEQEFVGEAMCRPTSAKRPPSRIDR